MSDKIAELEAQLKMMRKMARTKRKPVFGIGGRIQCLRETRSVGLCELATRAGISKGLLSRIESTRDANPCWHTIRAIARGLKVHPQLIVQNY